MGIGDFTERVAATKKIGWECDACGAFVVFRDPPDRAKAVCALKTAADHHRKVCDEHPVWLEEVE